MKAVKIALCTLLAALCLIGLASCASLSKVERRIQKSTHVDLDLSGCKIEQETDTHGGFLGDGEYLLVLDCSGKEEKILAQTNGWSAFPLSENLQEALYEWGPAERMIPPEIHSGAWYFYDRFADETAFDRHSDARLLSRPAENYSLLMYDSDTSRLYYYEMDT
jgi:hypothetical protein